MRWSIFLLRCHRGRWDYLATLYSANGWIGSVLAELGIKVAYTPLGIIVAMAFTSIPFVVRTVQLC